MADTNFSLADHSEPASSGAGPRILESLQQHNIHWHLAIDV